jgi:phytoene synthase
MARADDNARHCAAVVRAHAHAHYLAGLFVPAERRRSLYALHAFAHEIAQVRTLARQPMPGEVRLQWWRDAITGTAHGSVEANPVAAELLVAIAAHDLPTDTFEGMIDARRLDLYNELVPTLTALEPRLVATHGAVFALACTILGAGGSDVDGVRTHDVGVAMGLTDVLLDLPMYSARRQCVLPHDLLAREGAESEAIFSGRDTRALRRVARELAAHASTACERVLARTHETPVAVRAALLPLTITQEILRRMQLLESHPFDPRPPGRLRNLWLIWRAARKSISR